MLITNSDAGGIANTATTSACNSVARSAVHSSARCEPSVPSTPTTMVLIISVSLLRGRIRGRLCFRPGSVVPFGRELRRAYAEEVRARADADEHTIVDHGEVFDTFLHDALQRRDR